MNPAIIAAIIRAAGAQAARKGAQRGAASAAGKVNWGAIANGVADALPAVIQGASMVRKWRAGRDGSQGEGAGGGLSDDAEAEKMQKAFSERIEAGEKISIDEIARTPIHHLPPDLRDLAKTIRPQVNQENAAREKAGSSGPRVPVQVPQQHRVPRGWETRPSFGPTAGMPDPSGVDQRSGAPPIANEEQAKDRTLKQKLSDLVFAQTEKKRSQPEPTSSGIGGRGGDGAASGGAGGNGPGNLPPGSNPPGPSGDDDDEAKKSAKTFGDRLKDGALAVSSFLGPIGKAGVATVAFIKGLETLNTGVIALNRDLAQYNGGLAAAYAKYDSDEIQRDVYKGEELSGPLSELAEAQSELRDSTNQVTTQVQAIGIGVLTKATEMVNFLNQITGLTQAITFGLEQIRRLMPQKNVPDLAPWQSFLLDVSDGKFDGKRPVKGQQGGLGVDTFPGKQRLDPDNFWA